MAASTTAAAAPPASTAPPPRPPPTAKLRLVLLADTHNAFPSAGAFALPAGDVLVHAGDLTTRGAPTELAAAAAWLRELRLPPHGFQAVVVVAGNHDLSLDATFVARRAAGAAPVGEEEGLQQRARRAQRCRALFDGRVEEPWWTAGGGGQAAKAAEISTRLRRTAPITYLQHERAEIVVVPGLWREQLAGGQTAARAPQRRRRGTDGDATSGQHDEPLRPQARLTIFGSPFSPAHGPWAFGYAPEHAADVWAAIPCDADLVVTHTPPRSHCDDRGDEPALQQLGCEALRARLQRVRPKLHVCGHIHEGRGAEVVSWALDATAPSSASSAGSPRARSAASSPDALPPGERAVDRWQDPSAGSKKLSRWDLSSAGRRLRNGAHACVSGPSSSLTAATPPVDDEALAEGALRLETCIVNAAIMATSYPHRGGKRFNKPIVIDIDVPVEPRTAGGCAAKGG